nr:immunoglobulin heavy chain junction region [Mus musculus]NSM04479.1 immunoglobulin heavy chain junction region [Mus musculus]
CARDYSNYWYFDVW